MSKTAFVFPGQGSQSVGMLSELAGATPLVEATFGEASAILGYDLWALCQSGPSEELGRTEVTQPAMLTADIATWRAWQAAGGPQPDAMAGHSLGEYAALVAAGSLAFDAAVSLVAERGRLMQAATPAGVGAMAAILGLDDAALDALCTEWAGDEVVSCANFNAPGQVVIAGHKSAVDRVCEAARSAGARRALPLPVSVPSHCALMVPAAEQLRASLDATPFATPAVPVWHNADVATHDSAEAIRDALVRQLWQPVQWTRTVRALVDEGVDHFLECGPGKVLAGLNRRIHREANMTPLVDMTAIVGAIEGTA